MCFLRNERYKTYLTEFLFRRLGHAPRGRTCGYHWGLGSQKFFFPKFNQIWRVSYLHQWHMQRHIFFGPSPPGALGRGQKVKYHKISITKSISKIFKPNFVCLLTNERCKKISDGIFIPSPGSCPRGGT